jgi:hypothetical protein
VHSARGRVSRLPVKSPYRASRNPSQWMGRESEREPSCTSFCGQAAPFGGVQPAALGKSGQGEPTQWLATSYEAWYRSVYLLNPGEIGLKMLDTCRKGDSSASLSYNDRSSFATLCNVTQLDCPSSFDCCFFLGPFHHLFADMLCGLSYAASVLLGFNIGLPIFTRSYPPHGSRCNPQDLRGSEGPNMSR